MKRATALGLGLWALLVVAFALPLAVERHYQVDEIQNAYDARLFAVDGDQALSINLKHWTLAAGHLTRLFDTTQGMLFALRMVFFALFLLNLGLLAGGQPFFPSASGRAWVLLAATLLFPLWKFGFEVRHDVLLLTCQLGLYALAQRAAGGHPPGRGVFLAAGGLCAFLVTTTLKGLVYAGPYGLLVAVIGGCRAPDARWRQRLRPAAWMGVGALACVGLTLAWLAAHGVLERSWAGSGRFVARMDELRSFSALPRMVREALANPLPHALALVALVAWLVDIGRRRRPPAASMITGVFLVWSFCALQLNPTPFPYNQLAWQPFVALAALDGLHRLDIGPGRPQVLACLLLCVGLAWGFDYRYSTYGRRDNGTQHSYIAAAEALTGPNDPVLDGVGMALIRPPADKHWLLHSAMMPSYKAGRRTSFRAILRSEDPPPVAITNYRWSWLPKAHRHPPSDRYVQLARGFYVLGGQVGARTRGVEVRRGGRYVFLGAGGRPTGGLTLDGRPVGEGEVVTLSVGHHDCAPPARGKVLWHWLGPTLDAPPTLVPTTRTRRLFLNESYREPGWRERG